MPLDILFASIVVSAFALLCTALSYLAIMRRLNPVNQNCQSLWSQIADQNLLTANLSKANCMAAVRSLGNVNIMPVDLRSQHGEEFLLWMLSGMKSSGKFVEIGAHDGLTLSNSYFFEQLGWTGVLVEAHPELARRCRANRPGSQVCGVALGNRAEGSVEFSMVSGQGGMDTLSFCDTSKEHLDRIERRGGKISTVTVAATTVTALLNEHAVSAVDWMSIDVEGGEFAVLEGCDFKSIRPKVIMIEDNSRGSSDQLSKRMSTYGYRFVCRFECNAFFMDSSSQ